MEYTEIVVYLGDNFIGRFDSKERMGIVIADILQENWINGGNLDIFDFTIQKRIGKYWKF